MKTYRASKWYIVGTVSMAVAMSVIMISFAPYSDQERAGIITFFIGFSAVLALLSWLLVINILYSSIVITEDSIFKRSLFKSQRLQLDKIGGYYSFDIAYGIELLMTNGGPGFKIPFLLAAQPDLMEWVEENFYNKGESEQDKAIKELISNDLYTGTSIERILRFFYLRRITSAIYAASVSIGALCLASFYWPDDRIIVLICFGFPFFVLYLHHRYKGALTLVMKKAAIAPSISLAACIPVIAAFLKIASTYKLIHYDTILYNCVAIAICTTVVSYLIISRIPFPKTLNWALVFIGFNLLWGYTAILFVNCDLDNSIATRYSSRVFDKFISHSSKSVNFIIRIEPWGPVGEVDEIAVEGWQYHGTNIGDSLIFDLKAGRMGTAWYLAPVTKKN